MFLRFFFSSCVNKTKSCRSKCHELPAVDGDPSERTPENNVERLTTTGIVENLRQMSLLFATLLRRYEGHNRSLSSFYKIQASEIDLVQQQLNALQLTGNYLDKAALTRKLNWANNQLSAAWHRYEQSSIAANQNITHAYLETIKLVKALAKNLVEMTSSHWEDDSLDENADNDVDTTEVPVSCSDPTGPMPDPVDCAYYQQCAIAGARSAVRQKCGPGTLFNPVQRICDWPLNVYKVAPWCQTTKYLPGKGKEQNGGEDAHNIYAAALKNTKTTLAIKTPANRNASLVQSANEETTVYKITTPFPSTVEGKEIKKGNLERGRNVLFPAIIFLSCYFIEPLITVYVTLLIVCFLNK
jgi:hypothetical protein